MSVGEALIRGVFGLLDTAFLFVLLILLMSGLSRQMSKIFDGKWGRPDGDLFVFDPRRLWCKHRVAYYGPGTYGRWSVWCSACGREVKGR